MTLSTLVPMITMSLATMNLHQDREESVDVFDAMVIENEIASSASLSGSPLSISDNEHHACSTPSLASFSNYRSVSSVVFITAACLRKDLEINVARSDVVPALSHVGLEPLWGASLRYAAYSCHYSCYEVPFELISVSSECR